MSLPKRLKRHIIEALDVDASRKKVIGIKKHPQGNTAPHKFRLKREIDGKGFTRSGKHSLGRLTRHQHEIVNHVKSEFKAGNLDKT